MPGLGGATRGGAALTTKRGSQLASPLPLPRCSGGNTATMIESEIVIVDDDGAEEPFDTALWFASGKTSEVAR